jgi:hypothetical protein
MSGYGSVRLTDRRSSHMQEAQNTKVVQDAYAAFLK